MSAEDSVAAAFSGAARVAGYTEDREPPLVAVPAASEEEEQPVEEESLSAEDLAGLGTLTETGTPAIATQGFRGLMSKMGIKMAPSVVEQQAREQADQLRLNEEHIRQATWTRCVSVLVANRDGGAGKTPLSVCLGGTIAAVRGGGVAIVEVSDDPGLLNYRAEGTPSRGVGELVRDRDNITSRGQLSGYTAPQTSFAAVIGSVGHRPPLTRDDVTGIANVIDSYYELRVMDSGNQTSSDAFRGAAETADVLVMPMMNSGDAVMALVSTLESLRAQGGHAKELADRAIVIRLTDGRPEYPQVNERISRLLDSARVSAVYTIPFDQHIAERGQITLEKLNSATRAHFTAAAAGVIENLRANVQ